MSKIKQLDPVPEEFPSLEEAGNFWDTHDTTQYPNIFRTVQQGKRPGETLKYWKNSSVLKFAGARDPIKAITEKAQDVVFKAMEEGWNGPPFDPIALAQILNIRVVPLNNVGGDAIRDARIVADKSGGLTIEYNPNKSQARIRYSICHEIAHSFFFDCGEKVRHRLAPEEMHGADRQLELLCNLGAAELLMPIGSFPQIAHNKVTMSKILDLRKQFEVSTEAVLLRIVKLSEDPLAAFSAVASEAGGARRYAIEYCVTSKDWDVMLRPGFVLPERTALTQCIAIGFTTEASEIWKGEMGQIDLEAVGVPPYPVPAETRTPDYYLSKARATQTIPRVVGFIRPKSHQKSTRPTVTYLKRDATTPTDASPTVIAHIVNDKTPNWGAGFGRFLAKKWPEVQENFRRLWTDRGRLQLGTAYLTEVSPTLAVFHMISQHGYGSSPKPRLRYEELRQCLRLLADAALSRHARVQMPRIGAGEAGGSWPVIEEMIQDTLCRRGIAVTICDLPDTHTKEAAQLELVGQMSRTA